MSIRRIRKDTIPADHLMIIAAFRYCLGRRTYMVSHCRDWIVENWKKIPEHAKGIIKQDLEEAFAADEAARRDGDTFKPLGDDCDRGAWAHVRRMYRRPTCAQCGREHLQETEIGTVHLDGEVSCAKCHDGKCIVCNRKFKVGDTYVPVGRKGRHPGCAVVKEPEMVG